MEAHRHKTQKKITSEAGSTETVPTEVENKFANLLEDSAREAYTRPWHRIERGLRLNRFRIFVEDISPQHNMTKEEKEGFFQFLQRSHDKKLLNTLKVVNYDTETQRITTIKGLEMKRLPDGTLKWGFSVKKPKVEGASSTRKKKKEEIPSISTQIENVKIESESVPL